MKRLIIADVKSYNNNGKSTGHYFAVAQNYQDLYSDYCEVKVAGGPIFKTKFDKKDLFLLPHDFIPNKNWLKSKWQVLMNCRYLFKHTLTEDKIVIQQSGLSTAILGIALFAKRKSNIYVIAYDTDAVASPIKKMIYKLAKHKIKGLLCPHEHVANAYGIPNCIITDYIYAKKEIVPVTTFENKKYDIAIIGSICHGKGVPEAAKVLTKKNCRVLIAGKADKHLADKLHEICDIANNIELQIGFVSYENYYKYIREARFCLLNYHGVYEDRSSGVALDIIFNGTPILGHRCTALNFVEEENVGLLFDDINKFDFSILLQKDNYSNYLNGITSYLTKQKEFMKNIIEFLNLRN